MKMRERQRKLAITFLFTVLVLCYMFITLFVVGCMLYLLVRYDVLTGPGHTMPTPGRIILLFVPTSLAFGAIMTAFFGNIPMKGVNKLIDRMNRLASGDYKARMEFKGPFSKNSAVQEVSESFNRMAEELQNTEMLRSDFINNFSHEFKTPIVSIAGFAKLLRRGNLDEAQKEEYLRIIEEESLRLSQMATNVLNLTKVENQTILTGVTQFNLSEQIRSCMLLLSDGWEQKELELSLDFGEHYICADEELLKQVWINLLGNAVKFTPRGGLIEVTIEEAEDSLAVSVLNTGSEIPEEARDKIFRKFYQADESHSAEGNGIGLAIVKMIVDLHKGSISVDSGEGKTVFTLRLPKVCG